MALKSSLVGAAMMAGVAVTTGAGAQESPKVQSYTKDGAMSTLNIPMGNGEIGMSNANGNVISGAITLPTGACAVRLAVDVSADQRHALAALGCPITQNGSIIFGGSFASEKDTGSDARLTGQSVFVRVDMTNLTPSVRRIFGEVISKQANKKTLSVTDTPYVDITTQDFATFIRTIETTGVNRTTTAFSGGSSLSMGLGVEINVGRDGVMMASWHQTATRITGDTTRSNQASVGYAHYFRGLGAKASIAVDTNKTVTLMGEKYLGNDWSAGLAVTHNPTTGNAGFGRLIYTPGLKSSIDKRPDTGSGQLDETVQKFTTASAYAMRDVAGLGKRVEYIEKIQTGKNVTDAQVDTPASINIITPTITSTSISCSGTAYDVDAPAGFNYDVRCVVRNMSGAIVSATALTPSTSYTYTLVYNEWDKVTNTIKLNSTTAAQNFTTLSGYVTPTLPATLSDISVGDNGGIVPISFTINMPVLLDVNGNQIQYQVVDGLPSTDSNGPVVWSKSQTGSIITISGYYSGFGPIATSTVHITSPQATGSTAIVLKIITQ